MPNVHRPARLSGLLLLGLVLVGVGWGSRPADAYVQGPKNWSGGETTARYQRHAGTHRLSITNCGTATHAIELRVDIVNRADVGYGLVGLRCGGSSVPIRSNYDTYGSAYRGHFLQVQYGFYGTLRDQ